MVASPYPGVNPYTPSCTAFKVDAVYVHKCLSTHWTITHVGIFCNYHIAKQLCNWVHFLLFQAKADSALPILHRPDHILEVEPILLIISLYKSLKYAAVQGITVLGWTSKSIPANEQVQGGSSGWTNKSIQANKQAQGSDRWLNRRLGFS